EGRPPLTGGAAPSPCAGHRVSAEADDGGTHPARHPARRAHPPLGVATPRLRPVAACTAAAAADPSLSTALPMAVTGQESQKSQSSSLARSALPLTPGHPEPPKQPGLSP